MTQINLSWAGVAGALSYGIDRATNSAFTTGLVSVVQSGSGTTYSSTGLTAGTVYYYRVRAINAGGSGAWSATASSATTLPVCNAIGSGIFKIIARHSGKSLDVTSASTADGANIQQWTYTGAAQQKWTISPTSGGFCSVLSVNSGKSLDVASASTADGANIQQWTYTGANQQQFIFQYP